MLHPRGIAAVIVRIAIATSINVSGDNGLCDHPSASTQPTSTAPLLHAMDHEEELQLLQLQSIVVDGKQRGAKILPENHSGFVELVLAHGKDIKNIAAVKAWARSTLAGQLVFGFNGRYCERRFGGLLNHHEHDGNHGPEILNTITAMFIVLVGIYQLAAWNHQSAFIRLLCAMVVINGWSSAVRHYADVPFCAVLDGMTMVVGAVLGCCFLIDLVTQRATDLTTILVLRVIAWAGLPLLFCLCFCGNPHSFDPHTSTSSFRFMFALPLISVAVAVYGSLWRDWVTWTSVDHEALDEVKYHLLVGVPLCCLGAACLGASELFCDDSPIAQYFPGHALWHLLFPFGVNALLLYICALWADTKHQPLSFYKGDGWKARLFAIAPAFGLDCMQQKCSE